MHFAPVVVPVMALATSLLHASATGAPPTKPVEGTALTVYSSADPRGFDPQRWIQQQRQGNDNPWGVPGYGVVKVVRRVTMPQGSGTLSFTDVAAWIDPTTVSFVDLEDAATTVIEQSFQFDLVSPSKLTERYIGREVMISSPIGGEFKVFQGTLLSATQNQLVVQTGDGIHIVAATGAQITLGELPGGLLTKPTLLWKIANATAGEHLIRTTYQTAGITWRADYNLVLDGSESAADMSAWVTLLNLSGASYLNADLKLVAGDVQRIESNERGAGSGGMQPPAPRMAMDNGGFEEKSFFEYHLYALPRKTDVMQNATQQIALFPPVVGFKVKKELVFDFTGGMSAFGEPMLDRAFQMAAKGNPSVFVQFENKKNEGLGMPLPSGKVRVYKLDPADETLEFIGEDLIEHTPRNETVRIKLGEAFDVVGERTRTDFQIDTTAKRMSETFRIEIRNQKATVQSVQVLECMFRWTNWKIEKANAKFEKKNASTVLFEAEVPPEGKKIFDYTVVYTW
ncbi:MAG: DUF4139 domain-containing protein [Phycisphaerales bacterium]|nr:DUF4139 domain-containing protein [Phycisphaerales bacterium]